MLLKFTQQFNRILLKNNIFKQINTFNLTKMPPKKATNSKRKVNKTLIIIFNEFKI